MKKIVSVMLSFVLVMSILMSNVFAGDIYIVFDGKPLKTDPKPRIVDGRTLVPLRSIFEAMEATIDWNAGEKTITSVKGDMKLVIKIGSNIAVKNGEEIKIDVPAQIIADRTFVPLRFVAETFNAKVEFFQEIGLIQIESNPSDVPKEVISGGGVNTNFKVSKEVTKGEEVKVVFKDKANTAYTMEISDASGAIVQKATSEKTTDANGDVSWGWKTDELTKAGEYTVVVKGGDKSFRGKVLVK